jgi:hypothetical protein
MQMMGADKFVWFMGVVEDRNDPMRLGRIRVRISGLHTEKRVKSKTEGIPIGELPWAMPMQPITSAAMNGIGTTPLGPVEGTWVIGFFRDSINAQDPIVMGTLGGMPLDAPVGTGFNDPFMQYPKEDFLNEPDTHRRAVVDYTDTVGALHDSKTVPQDSTHLPIPRLPLGGLLVEKAAKFGEDPVLWNEPLPPHMPVYPFNHVRESECGHMEEWDDTPGSERRMSWHKSGTFEEIHSNGQRVHKVVSDNYEIVLGNNFIHVAQFVPTTVSASTDGGESVENGNLTITVDGNCHINVKKNMTSEVHGDRYDYVHGHYDLIVEGGIKIWSGMETLMQSSDDTTIIGANIHLNP